MPSSNLNITLWTEYLFGICIAELIGKDADNVSTDDPENEFDAWDNKS